MTSIPASEQLRYCAGQGSLVGLQEWLPTEPFDYDWGRNNPQIGCDHLQCARCGQRVVATPVTQYARRYQCRCTEYVASAQTPLGGDPDAYRGLSALENPPPHTWACAGHP